MRRNSEGMRGAQFIARGEEAVLRGCALGKGGQAVTERDWLTIDGAAELAARIAGYWRERTPPGRAPVSCRIEREAFSKSGQIRQITRGAGPFTLVVIRSNLIMELPPR